MRSTNRKSQPNTRPARRPLGATDVLRSVSTRRKSGQGNKECWRLEIERWPKDLRDDWEERAAIIEYCGGEPRAAAEWLAYQQLKPTEGGR